MGGRQGHGFAESILGTVRGYAKEGDAEHIEFVGIAA
jgi:hypothetical protein